MSDPNFNVGEKIKLLRVEKGMSIEAVSKESGISELTLSGIEEHTILPPLGEIVSLAKVFEFTVG